jgi:hypothetical protein
VTSATEHVTDPRHPLAVIIGGTEDAEPRLRIATLVRDAEALGALLYKEHGHEIRWVRDDEARGRRRTLLHQHAFGRPAGLWL